MALVIKKYSSPTFDEVFASSDSFVNGYKASPLYLSELTDANITLIYSLLSSKYGTTPIINKTEEAFKNKLYSVIYQYAPTWSKKLSIQTTLRGLSEADLILGTTTIYNRASNPETTPTTGTLDELTYVNDQNTQKFKRNKSQAWSELYSLLRDDITKAFLDRFRICFRNIVAGDYVLVEEEDEEDET